MASYDPTTGNYVSDSGSGSGGSSGTVNVANTPLPVTDNNGSLTIDGTVGVSNFPATQPVSGTVTVTPSGTQTVTGTVTTNPNLPVVSATSSALTAFRNVALTNTPVAVKASAGRVHAYHFANPNTTPLFVNLYNTAVGSVTVGTTVPLVTYMVATNAALDGYWTNSLAFSTAITIAVSTNVSTSVAPTNVCLATLGFV